MAGKFKTLARPGRVNAILSASGNWQVDESGELVVREVKTKKLEVGSSEQPEGVTLYDKLTGEAYCAAIAGGEWEKIKGTCSLPNETASSTQE